MITEGRTRRVLVIGEHRAASHTFLKFLNEHPVLEIYKGDHLQKSALQDSDLAVCFFPDPREHQIFLKEYPVLFILEQSSDAALFSQNLWRECLPSNAPVDEFALRINKFLELLTMHRQSEEMRRREALNERYLGGIDLTHSSHVAQRLVQLICENTRAENAVWVAGDFAQSWWSQANRRRSLPSAEAMRASGRYVWHNPVDAPIVETLDASTELAAIGRDWITGDMVMSQDRSLGLMRLVSQRHDLDLGYVIVRNPQRPLRSGRRWLKKLEQYLAYALAFEENQRLIFVDDLTALYNQRYLPGVVGRELERAQKEQKPFSVLFLDIDYFKSVNDSRGHLVGSKLLIEVAKLIRGTIRDEDYAFRYGGDEFVVLLPGAETQTGREVAERIRASVESTEFLVYQKRHRLTVSIGLASYPDHARTAEEVLQMADDAMYNAKRAQRNKVYIAS